MTPRHSRAWVSLPKRVSTCRSPSLHVVPPREVCRYALARERTRRREAVVARAGVVVPPGTRTPACRPSLGGQPPIPRSESGWSRTRYRFSGARCGGRHTLWNPHGRSRDLPFRRADRPIPLRRLRVRRSGRVVHSGPNHVQTAETRSSRSRAPTSREFISGCLKGASADQVHGAPYGSRATQAALEPKNI